jgi:hypothetical protein
LRFRGFVRNVPNSTKASDLSGQPTQAVEPGVSREVQPADDDPLQGRSPLPVLHPRQEDQRRDVHRASPRSKMTSLRRGSDRATGGREPRLGKGAAFVKEHLKRLRQENENWEAHFQALPKPITQSETHYQRLVIVPDGPYRADSHVEGRPTVNDMATLLAHVIRRPLAGKAHRPCRLHVRGHPQWGSYSRTWKNAASRPPFTGNCPKFSEPTIVRCGGRRSVLWAQDGPPLYGRHEQLASRPGKAPRGGPAECGMVGDSSYASGLDELSHLDRPSATATRSRRKPTAGPAVREQPRRNKTGEWERGCSRPLPSFSP